MLEFTMRMLESGLANLAAYLAAHVLLCLLPAFCIAGAMTALIPKEIVTRYLGRNTRKVISYPASAAAGFLLAVCSCTVIPLFAGIYRKGAGLGPAMTFLFVAPAVNILALSYTGKVLGMDLAIARLVLSITFGIGIGIIMAGIFHQEDMEHDQATDVMFAGQASIRPVTIVFLMLLVALLVVGTFQIEVLTQSWFQITIPITGVDHFQEYLQQVAPFDPAKGEEGITAQGAVLIGLLVCVGLAAWKGIETIFDGFNAWTWTTIGLLGLTVSFASLQVLPQPGGVSLLVSGKFLSVSVIATLAGWMLKTRLTEDEARSFLWESWRFVKQIFPLLVMGVFLVGMIRELIQPEWIQTLAGENTVPGNFIGVAFGVFMYFPTLVEVPIAQMFLGMGMHRGPLLAYLISDPELSLQSILITASIIGRTKAWTYVGLVALFSTLAGLLYGEWVDGTSVTTVASYLLATLSLLAVPLLLLRRKNNSRKNASEQAKQSTA